MIYPRPSENGEHPPHAPKRRSASPATLIAVATLSVAGVLVGMGNLNQYSELSRQTKDSMMTPGSMSDGGGRWVGSSGSGDEVDVPPLQYDDADDELDAPLPPIDTQSIDNDEQYSFVSGDEDSQEEGGNVQQTKPQSSDEPSEISDEQFTESKSDDASTDEAVAAEEIFTADRRFFNTGTANEQSIQSLRRRETPRPRITTLDGAKGMVYNLRDESSDEPRRIEVSRTARNQQKRLKVSDDFSYRDPLYEGDCVPMQPWQETSFPNCNLFHELDFAGKTRSEEFEYYAKGGYNQIFWINEEEKLDDPEMVVKILKWGTTYSDRNFDRVRRDGLILERLTKSPYVLDSYGFCGFDVLTPYAKEGTLSSELRRWERGSVKLTPKTRLRYATEAAEGLAAVHDIDGEGLSSVAHGDLKGGQYLLHEGVWKLGDFNRGRFLRRNATATEKACTYTIGKNDAAFRSPEEYEYLPQTSAIDVYALGSILYEILTGREVWHDTDTKKAQRYIRKGELPEIPQKLLESSDPVDVALREAIDMCYVFDPEKRAKAGEVARFLQKALSKLS